jgi:hypothetical protein
MLALMALAATVTAGGLSGEVEEFLNYQARQGLEVQAVQMLELDLMSPCTLAVPPFRRGLSGYLTGFGGNHTLDLWISIADSTRVLDDTLPDDVPVLRLDAGRLGKAGVVVLEARDMTHGAVADSAAVMWLLSPEAGLGR